MAAGAAVILSLMPGIPMLPFIGLAGLAGAGAWYRHNNPIRKPVEEPVTMLTGPSEPPITDALKLDLIRLELGYGLLSLAGGDAPRLTEQIKGLRRAIATELGFVLPPVRIQDNLQLEADEYCVRIKEIEAGRGVIRPTKLLVMDPRGGTPDLPGEPAIEPTFGLPALWIDQEVRDEAVFRGCTVVDPPSVLSTHLTELVKQIMPELLSYAETQKLVDELPREHQRLVADLIPTQINLGAVQRVLQSLLAERVSIRDLPTILEGIGEACGGQNRAIPAIVGHVRTRLSRQLCDAYTGPNGYLPLITLSAEWEEIFAAALVGPPEDRQLALAPSKLTEFVQRLRTAFDAAGRDGEAPVLLTSGNLRSHLRAIVERIRPETPVLAQAEISPRARIRTVGTI
jgi:flagellar biosynthesis protein FlhA